MFKLLMDWVIDFTDILDATLNDRTASSGYVSWDRCGCMRTRWQVTNEAAVSQLRRIEVVLSTPKRRGQVAGSTQGPRGPRPCRDSHPGRCAASHDTPEKTQVPWGQVAPVTQHQGGASLGRALQRERVLPEVAALSGWTLWDPSDLGRRGVPAQQGPRIG